MFYTNLNLTAIDYHEAREIKQVRDIFLAFMKDFTSWRESLEITVFIYLGRAAVLKQILWCSIIISLMLYVSACSKSKMATVLDDISRDTYEKNMKEQRIENLGNPNYEEPPTYDQYQRDRKELISDQEETPPETERKQ